MRLFRRAGVLVMATFLALVTAGASGAATSPDHNASTKRYQSPVFTTLKISRDVQYGSAIGPNKNPVRLGLDLYQPVGDTARRRPVLVWVHGGGFQGGDKTDPIAVEVATLFARLGYVTASINYRLLAPPSGCETGQVTAACYTAAVAAADDAKAAVRWLRAHAAPYRLDGNRIGIGGESAGAIVSTEVGTTADSPGNSGNPGYPSRVAAWIAVSGGVPGGLLVDRTDAPGLLFAFAGDTVVPYAWSVQTADAMRRAGVPVRLVTLPGAGHVGWDQYGVRYEHDAIAFLYRYLKLAQLGCAVH